MGIDQDAIDSNKQSARGGLARVVNDISNLNIIVSNDLERLDLR